jgi:hypothetical protein
MLALTPAVGMLTCSRCGESPPEAKRIPVPDDAEYVCSGCIAEIEPATEPTDDPRGHPHPEE